jgi:hypothetical protein
MTDDELDRALFALPLEEPPADLHARIMSATVLRATPAFKTWELVVLGLMVLAVGGLTAFLFVTTPDAGERLADWTVTGLRSLGLFHRATYAWLAIGISSVWWISSLTFMATPRPTVYNR